MNLPAPADTVSGLQLLRQRQICVEKNELLKMENASPEHQAGDASPATATANFNGWWVADLPFVPLAKIASYLSENDRNNLGKTCTQLRNKLIARGIIEHPTISLTPWLTVELDRQGSSRLRTYGQHNRLMKYYLREDLLRIWAPKEDGIWRREAVFPCDLHYFYHEDTLFIPRHFYKTDGYLLFIFHRNAHGAWSETQRLNFNDLYNLPDSEIDEYPSREHISNIKFSPDNRSLASMSATKRVAILGQGFDGKWQHQGQFQPAHEMLFSHDSHHIALIFNEEIHLMSKNDNGLWVGSGAIDMDYGPEHTAFSPDNRHFVTFFIDGGTDSKDAAINPDEFYVMVGGLNRRGQWSKKMRINKIPRWPTQYYIFLTEFSPDGKHLVVGTETDFEVWTLNDDNWVLSRPGAAVFDQNRGYWTLKNNSVVEFISNDEFMLFSTREASLWMLNSSGSWSCSLVFPYVKSTRPLVSPDGNTIFTQNRSASAELWLRRDGWEKLSINYTVEQVIFNDDSSLLAMKCDNLLIIFRKSTRGYWKEKCQLKLDGDFKSCSFSKCGRTITIHYKCDTRLFMTHLRITENND